MHIVRLAVTIVLAGHFLVASAQEFRATIVGRITDSSGSVVPGVQVKATQLDTNNVSRTVSTESGDYTLAFLPSGKYRIEAERQGFRKFVRDGIVLRVQDRISVDVQLQVGELTESITVSGETPLLETASASFGAVVSQRTVIDMPLNGRNPYGLIYLIPGALPTGRANWNFFLRLSANGAGATQLSVSGSPSGSNEVLLDGVSVTSSGNSEMYVPSVDATQEFKVQTNSFDAEFGRFLGGVVNATIKSGTNDFHGSLAEFLRNSSLNARDFFATYKPKFQYNQFGAAAGGPVVLPRLYNGKNRTFIFGSYEGSREGVPRTFVSTVPTALEHQGDFSQTYTRLTSGAAAQVTIYDPSTTRLVSGAYVRDPFPGNTIPSNPNRFNPVAVKLMSLYPLPSTTGDSITHANNYPVAFKDPVFDDGFVVKADHRVSDRNQMFARVSYRHFFVSRRTNFNNDVTGNHENRYAWGVAFDDTFTLNPTTVFNVRYGMSRLRTAAFSNRMDISLAALGFPSSLDSAVDLHCYPTVSLSGYYGLPGCYGGTGAYETHSLHAGVLKNFGSHSIRAGADIRLGRDNGGPGGYSSGSYAFSSGFTNGPNPQVTSLTGGNAAASFLLGLGSSGSLAYSASTAELVPYYGFYFQDDVRVTNKLTMNLGLRYEWEGAHTERYNRLNRGFDLNAASPIEAQAVANYALSPISEVSASQFKVKGGLLFAGVNGLPRSLSNTDHNNVAPRIGLAYTVTPKTVLRGGWGLFYGPTSGTTNFGFSSSTTWVTTVDGGLTPVDTVSNPFPNGITPPPAASQGLMTQVGQGASFVDDARQQLYAQRFQFSIQRQLPGQMLVEAGYAGLRGGDYPVTRTLNAVPEQFRAQARQVYLATKRNILNDSVSNPFYGLITSGTLAAKTTTRGQLLFPYPQFTSLSKRNVSSGSSQYNSFQLKVSKRFSAGFSLLVAYTNAKSIDKTSYLNPNDTELTRSLSTFDVPQRIVVSGTYELPVGHGRHFLSGAKGLVGKVAGGWQFNWTYTAQSGIPLSVSSAESLGRSAKLSADQQTRLKWFDTSAFRLRETLELVGTYLLPDVRTAGRNNIDFSIFKDTLITEKLKLQFRAESFNLFNRTEFGDPNTSLGSSAFGIVSGQINFARQNQFALRMTW